MKRSATITQVAEQAGVSLGTVSNYINGTKAIAPATAERIEHAIAELSFVPNRAVRTLRGKRSNVIGFVVPDGANPFFTELARHVEDEARDRGCVVVFCDTAGDEERERAYLRSLAEMRVNGVILTSVNAQTRNLGDLHAVGAPIVLLGDDKPGLDAASITVDHHRGGYLGMSHLLSIGRRRILYAGGPAGGAVLDTRVEGARQAIRDHGLEAETRLHRVDAVGRSVTERAALVDAVLDPDDPADAVLCGNDMIAFSILNALIRRGVRVPEDVAVVGHDDIELAAQTVVPLTTVRQPIAELGRLAAELLFRQTSGERDHPPQHLIFTPELVVRESTVAAR